MGPVKIDQMFDSYLPLTQRFLLRRGDNQSPRKRTHPSLDVAQAQVIEG
jgi:hypothetical protein